LSYSRAIIATKIIRWETMAELKRKGMIRAVGVISYALELAKEAAKSDLYDTMQFPSSLLVRGSNPFGRANIIKLLCHILT
jgi:aryl-alcohol dehydrogenase-like predicted oxidoreductase